MEGRPTNIPSLLKSASRRWPDETALRFEKRTLTFAALERRVGKAACRMWGLGVRPGGHVALMASTPHSIFQWLGLARLGAVTVPINTALRGFQLSHVLNHSESTDLIVERAFLDPVAALGKEVAGLKRILALDFGEDEAAGVSIPVESLAQDPAGVSLPPEAHLSPGQAAAILYTGGTTGPSKGVICSHGQYGYWAELMARAVRLEIPDTWYTCLPFFHVNAQGTLLASLKTGAACAVSPRFSASRYWRDVDRHDATVASLLGTMATILHNREAPGPRRTNRLNRRLRVFCPGISADLQRGFEERFGLEVVNAYGMTELNCVTATSPRTSPPGSMGRVMEEFQVRVVDDGDSERQAGEPGELIVRPRVPHSVMSGYFRMPEETERAWRAGWFHTGDRVYRDRDDNLFFVDRIKDCIRRRGENISSFEVEHVLNGHPDVQESAAYPVPSELGEDEVMVSLVPRPNRQLDPEDLIDWCRRGLADFALPRFIAIVGELPKTPVGRVQKFKLRQAGVREGTWDREGGAGS